MKFNVSFVLFLVKPSFYTPSIKLGFTLQLPLFCTILSSASIGPPWYKVGFTLEVIPLFFFFLCKDLAEGFV